MKSILEIPVFAPQDYFINLISNADKNYTERPYQDFSLFEIDLDENYCIYFYLLKSIPELGLDLLIDQVIPKAPLSFMFLDTGPDFDSEKTKALYLSYIERYLTPIFLCSSKQSSETAEAFGNELSLGKFGSKLLLYEDDDPTSLKKVILEVLKFITIES